MHSNHFRFVIFINSQDSAVSTIAIMANCMVICSKSLDTWVRPDTHTKQGQLSWIYAMCLACSLPAYHSNGDNLFTYYQPTFVRICKLDHTLDCISEPPFATYSTATYAPNLSNGQCSVEYACIWIFIPLFFKIQHHSAVLVASPGVTLKLTMAST